MSYVGNIESLLSKAFDCSCGQRHDVSIRHVKIEAGALKSLPDYCAAAGIRSAAVAVDARTLKVAGDEVRRLLLAAGIEARVIVLRDTREGDIVADEAGIVGLLKELPPETEAIIAVGGGTIHDIVRFACYVGRRRFLSVPTAPSVDGFASVGAPLVIGGFKNTVPAMAPEAIFADLDVLCQAPMEMIAAGFGDMLGKYTSLADWRLGHLLTGEHFCPLCSEVTRQALEACIQHLDDIAAARPEGIKVLMEALILSGISILLLGNSRPASGAEHHLSHFWEMRYLQEGRKALLHGAKVGAATVIICELYEELARLLREEDAEELAECLQPSKDQDLETIRLAFGPAADHVLAENDLSCEAELSSDVYAAMRNSLVANHAELLAVAQNVPSPKQAAEWLAAVGGITAATKLGVSADLQSESLGAAYFVRSRMTVLRLLHMLKHTS